MSRKKLVGHEEEIGRAYEGGTLVSELCSKYECSNVTIYNCLKKLGIPRREMSLAKRKHVFDENFFDTIDTEAKAYVLGLMYADGCNASGVNSVVLCLKDRELVLAVATAMGSAKAISPHDKMYHKAVFTSARLSAALSSKGCPPRKTHTLTFPDAETVPIDLRRHFIRGYFDGDGCVHARTHKKYINVHIVGTQNFLLGVAGAIPCRSSVLQRSKSKMYYLGISSEIEALKFRDYIYKDATVCLNRKKELFYHKEKLPLTPLVEISLVAPELVLQQV